ncbi:MAG: acyl-CoA thioesterase domain-containing protein [Candidatus Nanopelagicales bacterium]
MAHTLAELLELLTLDRVDDDNFVGHSPGEHAFTRVFGGQLFAQMLIAANATVGDDRDVHSMHAYFLRPGDQRTPIEFEVGRGLDGRAFSNRTVIARQAGKQICNFAASFATPGEGPEFQEWQPTVPAPDVLPPAPDFDDQYAEVMSYVAGTNAIEFRFEEGIAERDPSSPGRWQVWFRVKDELPDDQAIHSAMVAYASDIFLLETTLRPHSVGWLDDIDFATIDYSMWFHRPISTRWLELALIRCSDGSRRPSFVVRRTLHSRPDRARIDDAGGHDSVQAGTRGTSAPEGAGALATVYELRLERSPRLAPVAEPDCTQRRDVDRR